MKYDLPTPDDVIRLFSIIALARNRDIAIGLGTGKCMNRKELEEDKVLSSFFLLSDQFNDVDLVLVEPHRAVFLTSYTQLDANNPSKVGVVRKVD